MTPYPWETSTLPMTGDAVFWDVAPAPNRLRVSRSSRRRTSARSIPAAS